MRQEIRFILVDQNNKSIAVDYSAAKHEARSYSVQSLFQSKFFENQTLALECRKDYLKDMTLTMKKVRIEIIEEETK